jgi:hypothetical protein
MNALYADNAGEVFDPTGGGLDDIASRRIVFVGDPETRIREDYLRILRFFRFQAWYGRTCPIEAGLAACANCARASPTSPSNGSGWKPRSCWPRPSRCAAARRDGSRQASSTSFSAKSKGLKLLRKLVGLDMREGFAPDPR